MSVTIRDTMTDEALFGGQFSGESWSAWRALLAGFYGLPLNEAEQDHWQALTGRTEPTQPHDELWLVVGRRGGKSQCAALLAVYEAAFRDHTDRLSPGEVATVAVLAADRKQARTVFRYVSGLLRSNPMTEQLIVKEDRETLELVNRTAIEITTASYRSTRGYTFAAVLADELAFWRSEDSANPDSEIINAVRPGLATLQGPLIALSSPYSRRGELWENYRRHYGQESPILVAQAASRTMNPALPERVVSEAYERDPATAKAEYGAEFRSDVEAFLTRETVEDATRAAPLEMPHLDTVNYQAFIDPAGGGADEFCLAIGHTEDDTAVVDVLRARKGTPAEIAAEYAALMREYGVSKAQSDRYGGSWPRDEFARHGVTVEASAKPKSELYQEALAAFNSGRVQLPPDERLTKQFIELERRTSRAGKDSIDHPPNGHDDRANAVAGLVVDLTKRPYKAPRLVVGY
ncbi:hypothetical protein [Halospina sp. K52047b]|uniref:phage terminase large subunit family protein n=1 Tax=Halospina sp. K52047b TaxID=2614160 RepID=UPI00124ABFB2|nr:hypothetical protein [Halospina sp. K52047b]KAA8984557.1 hypothetical protein F3089_04210 [Halospina sp. K52047b]